VKVCLVLAAIVGCVLGLFLNRSASAQTSDPAYIVTALRPGELAHVSGSIVDFSCSDTACYVLVRR
jgi:hypothetical protein